VAEAPAIFFSLDAQPRVPDLLRGWLERQGIAALTARGEDEMMGIALRGRPRLVAFDGSGRLDDALRGCRRLKADTFTGVIPTVILGVPCQDAALATAFEAGADEVICADASPVEASLRLDALIRRADRDLYVHPSTRLPGPPGIEAEILRRMETGEQFAVCYADLDHFKEFNDRYSYAEGDRVIRILATLLHDVVKGLCPADGFVGHIGGDDFIFMVPADRMHEVCDEIVSVFELLVPFQYSEQDRRAGYFFGKDRRGQLHRVPLMTLSIGIVTNERRRFTHPAQVSELATEMKSYAKTLPGSIFVADRRHDEDAGESGAAPVQPDVLGIGESK
jgi:GGDEF domain-containing protein